MTGNWDITTLLAGAGAAGGRRVTQRAGAAVADRIGEMLASRDPATFQRAIRTIANDDRLLNNLRNGMARLAKGATPSITHEINDQRESQPSQ
jgi:hypothetical protein